MSTKNPSRVVFVGNIPYGLSEEQISDIFSGAGQVLNFRLVYDRETGKPKGFGFAEYPDADSAASAVRNLNDYEIMGRKLRVDFSNESPTGDDGNAGSSSRNQPPRAQDNQNGGQGAVTTALPPLPPGRDLPPGVTATDEISRVLQTLPPSQLLDILHQMKDFCMKEPARATELLSQAPQLSYALMQSLLLFDLVSPEAIQASLEPGGPSPPVPQVAAAPQTYTPPIAATTPAPVVSHAQAPTPAAAPSAAALPPDVLQQVLQLPQATIDGLPPAERASVMALRAQYGM